MSINRKTLLVWLLTLYILALLMNASSLIPFEFLPVEETESLKIRFGHVLFIPFFFIAITYSKNINKKILSFTLILIILIIYSTIISQYWWVNHYIVNYLWSALCFFCAGVIASNKNINSDFILNILVRVTIIFYSLVFIKNLFYLNDFLSFFQNPNVHPLIPTLVGGGLNLEASFITMMSIFAYKKKKLFYILFLFSFLCSILYSSRVGIISGIFVILFVSYFYSINKIVFILKIICALVVFVGIFYVLSINDVYVVERLNSIGDPTEAGTRGRLYMWVWIYPTIIHNIWGYGAGNAVEAISYIAGNKAIFWNSNIHLYPMQVLLDFGILGFLFYLYIFAYVIKQVIKANSNSFAFFSFVLIYIFLGFIQFKGGEPLIYLVGGFAVGFNKNKED